MAAELTAVNIAEIPAAHHDATLIRPAVIYANKKPGSAFSEVVPSRKDLPPKKRIREIAFRETVQNILNPPKDNDFDMSVPDDVKFHPDGSVSRTIYMSKNQMLIGLANEVDVNIIHNPAGNPVVKERLLEQFKPICTHISNCKNKKCYFCAMTKVLSNPDHCHALMNHSLRCDPSTCTSRVCKIFKTQMLFKFMATQYPDSKKQNTGPN
jgi:hypothetical protein